MPTAWPALFKLQQAAPSAARGRNPAVLFGVLCLLAVATCSQWLFFLAPGGGDDVGGASVLLQPARGALELAVAGGRAGEGGEAASSSSRFCSAGELRNTSSVVRATNLFGSYQDVCVDYEAEALYLAPWAKQQQAEEELTVVDELTVFPFKGRLSEEQARARGAMVRHSGTSLLMFIFHGSRRRRWDNICHFSSNIFPLSAVRYASGGNGCGHYPFGDRLAPERVAFHLVQAERFNGPGVEWQRRLFQYSLNFSTCGHAQDTQLLFIDEGDQAPLRCFDKAVVMRHKGRMMKVGGGELVPSWRWFPTACAAREYRAAVLTSVGIDPEAYKAAGKKAVLLLRVNHRHWLNGEVVAKEATRWLEQRGWEVVKAYADKEWESLDRQLHTLHDARLLISPHGAQLTNIPFLAPGGAIVETHACGVSQSASYVTIAAEAGIRYFDARPPGSKCAPRGFKGKHRDYETDFDTVIRPALEQL